MSDIKRIRSFLDLDVYQSTYAASITVLTKIIPKLPKEERFDLADQLRRSVKAVPRLIAEAYAKRRQIFSVSRINLPDFDVVCHNISGIKLFYITELRISNENFVDLSLACCGVVSPRRSALTTASSKAPCIRL